MSENTHWPTTYSLTQAQLGTSLSPHRLFRWAGSPPVAALCGAGVDADGVTGPAYIVDANAGSQNPIYGTYRLPGRPVKVETGGTFVGGSNLQSDGSGRCILHASGPVVLRALEGSSGAGQIIWAVFAR